MEDKERLGLLVKARNILEKPEAWGRGHNGS